MSANTPKHPATSRRLNRAHTSLLVVDLQERLLPSIWEQQRVLKESSRLIQGAQLLGLPILATEQYRKGLGPTVPDITTLIRNFLPIQKLTFSACTDEVMTELRRREISDVVLCGIETHVCVCQTALDLLDAGFRVFVAGEACSSRTRENWQIGLERMQAAGATPVSVEMVLFELLERAGTDEFKRMLPLVK